MTKAKVGIHDASSPIAAVELPQFSYPQYPACPTPAVELEQEASLASTRTSAPIPRIIPAILRYCSSNSTKAIPAGARSSSLIFHLPPVDEVRDYDPNNYGCSDHKCDRGHPACQFTYACCGVKGCVSSGASCLVIGNVRKDVSAYSQDDANSRVLLP